MAARREAVALSGWRSVARSGSGFIILTGLIGAVGGAMWWVGDAAPKFDWIKFELAGVPERAREVLGTTTVEALRSGVRRDYALILAYGALFAVAGIVGIHQLRTGFARALAAAAGAAGVFAAICDAVENRYLSSLLDSNVDSDTAARYMLAVSVPKWLLVAFATLVGLGVWWTALGRFVRSGRELPDFPSTTLPPLYDEAHPWCWPTDQSRFQWNHHTYPLPEGDGQPSGICLSGGGIRSASFGLGAMQVLARTPAPGNGSILGSTDYLACVSGGAYLGGALQSIAKTEADKTTAPPGPADPHVFANGTPEEDHLRRHGRYLADSSAEWAVAVARLLAGLTLNLVILVLLLFALGRPIGFLQRNYLFDVKESTVAAQPLQADAAPKSAEEVEIAAEEIAGLQTTDGMWIAFAWPLAIALLVLLGGTLVGGADNRWRDGIHVGAVAFALLAVAVLAVVWLLPWVARMTPVAVAWIGARVLGGDASTAGNVTVFTVLSTSAGGTLFAVLRTPAPMATSTTKTRINWAKYTGWIAKAAPYVTGAILAVAAVTLFAQIVAGSARGGFEWPFGIADRWVYAGVIAALALLYALADQTRWSLHPFYKRRLATAFAVERQAAGVARELPYSTWTRLSEWGQQMPGLPKLLICAAANVSGQDIAPAGRRAVSFVFASDYVGGPQVGWARTEDYEAATRKVQKADATLQGAVAISGAAFASAMGRHSKGSVNALLAVTNARLGVWLPNPRYVAELRGAADTLPYVDDAKGPWVRRRRFTYLLKEIVGMYNADDRFLYLSDGGHYENLGLVELMRRRCGTILCFDAAGDSLETCGTFVEALSLAAEELGTTVTIDLTQLAPVPAETESAVPPTQATVDLANMVIEIGPDTPEPTVGVLRLLAGRLSSASVAVGTVAYRDIPGRPAGETGTLVLGKASLTEETPLDVLTHAARGKRPVFPNDPTGDQWFDGGQFNAYRQLGEHVGTKVVEALNALEGADPGAVPVPSAAGAPTGP